MPVTRLFCNNVLKYGNCGDYLQKSHRQSALNSSRQDKITKDEQNTLHREKNQGLELHQKLTNLPRTAWGTYSSTT